MCFLQWWPLSVSLGVLAATLPVIVTAADNAQSSDNSSELQEIVVSAQRREESIDKVPISIAAFSQKTMDDLHIERIADLATIVPGLYLSHASPGNQDFVSVAIRGIVSNNNAPTTQFYIDETPIAIRQMQSAGNSGSPLPLIFDLDRVEVLRGPQGTLFGASAMGGAIRFITPQPNLHESDGFAKAELAYTENGSPIYETGAAYGGPIVDGSVGFRVSAWYQSAGGFIDREDPFTGQILRKNANSSNSYVVRPAITWAPTDGLTITPALFLQHKHSENPDSYWLNGLANPERNGHVWGGLAQPLTDNLRIPSLAIKYTFRGLTLQSDTSYLDRESQAFDDFTETAEYIFSGQSAFPGLNAFHTYFTDFTFTHAWQQEFRLSSQDSSSRINWVLGAYYRNSVQDLKQLVAPDLTPLTEAVFGKTSLEFFTVPNYVYNGQVLNAFQDFRATDVSEAIFADTTINLTSRLKGSAGVRIEHTVVQDQRQIAAGPLSGPAYSNQVLPDVVATPVTPRASLTFQYTDTDMVYATVAKGFRPGGANAATVLDNALCVPSLKVLGLSAAPAGFNADSLWSYEIGAKDLVFDRRVSIEGSAYYIKWSNIQSNVTLPSCQVSFTANRGEAVSKGADLQIAAVVADGLKVGANFGYTDTYYPHAAYGLPLADGSIPLLNAAGDKFGLLRPWSVAVNAEYSRDIGALWAGARSYLRIDFRHLSAAYSTDPTNPSAAGYDPQIAPHSDSAYGILNIRLGVTHGGWDVSAFVNNATNSDPIMGYQHAAIGDTLYQAAALSPLTAGITAWYRF